MNYEPKEVDEISGFVWHCAFADCLAKPYVLPGYLYDRIDRFGKAESSYYNAKWFKTKENAMDSLKNAFDKLSSDIENYYCNLPREDQLSLFPKLQAIFKTGDFIWRKT